LPPTRKGIRPPPLWQSAISPTTLLSRFPPENFVKINKRFRRFFYTVGDPWDQLGRERGGARLARSMAGTAGTDNRSVGNGCQLCPPTVTDFALAAKAGGFCHRQAKALSLLARRMVRLLAGDSSISLLMARRSSVAETTGKRMTSMHPRASTHCTAVNLRTSEDALEPCHNQKAGTANNSHARLSSNSIRKDGREKRPFRVTSFSEISISSQCDFREQEGCGARLRGSNILMTETEGLWESRECELGANRSALTIPFPALNS
jgi:hypothetical protein